MRDDIREESLHNVFCLLCRSGESFSAPCEGVYHSEELFLLVGRGHVGEINLPILSWQTASGWCVERGRELTLPWGDT